MAEWVRAVGNRDAAARIGILVGCLTASLLLVLVGPSWLPALGAFPLVFLFPGLAFVSGLQGAALLRLVALLGCSSAVAVLAGLGLAAAGAFHKVPFALTLLLLGLAGGIPWAYRAGDVLTPLRDLRRRVPTARKRGLWVAVPASVVCGALLAAGLAVAVVSTRSDRSSARTVAVWAAPVGGAWRVGFNGLAGPDATSVDVSVRLADGGLVQMEDIAPRQGRWSEELPPSAVPTQVTVTANGRPLRTLQLPP